MQIKPQQPDKPVSQIHRLDLTQLPELTRSRRLFRCCLRAIARGLMRLFTKSTIQGLEHFPDAGPFLIVSNHLGDLDAIFGLSVFPRLVDAVGKIELYETPILGKLLQAYGVIWIRRGQPDRKALRVALQALDDHRIIAIAPEGRYSLIQGLETGAGGAAYLAIKGEAPLLPVTFIGTENERVYSNLRRFHRSVVAMRIGKPFRLAARENFKLSVSEGTETIMRTLASQLPVEYQGIYQ